MSGHSDSDPLIVHLIVKTDTHSNKKLFDPIKRSHLLKWYGKIKPRFPCIKLILRDYSGILFINGKSDSSTSLRDIEEIHDHLDLLVETSDDSSFKEILPHLKERVTKIWIRTSREDWGLQHNYPFTSPATDVSFDKYVLPEELFLQWAKASGLENVNFKIYKSPEKHNLLEIVCDSKVVTQLTIAFLEIGDLSRFAKYDE